MVTLRVGEEIWSAEVSLLHRAPPGALLRTMQVLARRARIQLLDAQRIAIIPGPGRFSVLRSGVVLANALSWASGVQLQSHGRSVRIVRPEYGREPHIQIPQSVRVDNEMR